MSSKSKKKVTAKKSPPKTTPAKKGTKKSAVRKKAAAKKTTTKKAISRKPAPAGSTTKKSTAKKVGRKDVASPAPKSAPKRLQFEMDARKFLREIVRTPEAEYNRAKAALEKFLPQIRKVPGFISAEVGMKLQGGHSTREFAICVIVDRRRTDEELAQSGGVPPFYDGVPTDVQVCEFAPAHCGVASPFGGAKIRPQNSTATGTLGIDVVCDDGFVRLLTCTHVVSSSLMVNSPVPMLDALSNAPIGTVGTVRATDWEFSDVLDCALVTQPQIVVTRNGMQKNPQKGLFDPVRIRIPVPDDVVRERPVWKLGAESCLTAEGKILSIDASPPIPKHGIHTRDQIRIGPADPHRPFAIEGDSGALVCMGDEAIGVIRAVDVQTGHALACPLAIAARQLGFSI